MAKKNIPIEVKKRDGGFYFPAVDIHVVAKDEKAAIKLIKDTHYVDVQQVTNELAEREAAERAKS